MPYKDPQSKRDYDRNRLLNDLNFRRINSKRHRIINLKKKYGLTLEEYENLFIAQNGVCAICGQPEKTEYKRNLSVDHNHETGKVRGLLCHRCNTGIGKFNDNLELLEQAAEYLRGGL